MEKIFKLRAHGTTVRREVLAGITTFLTMAYILAVNPGMLGQIGNGMTAGPVFTATAIAAAFATLVMAFTANLPVALAPGMGLNAFFTYTVVMGMGYSWQLALTAVFLEGIAFILLSFFNVREKIIDAIPGNLKNAVSAGIGLFIALIGFINGGVVVANPSTVLSLGDLSHGPALLTVIGLVLVFVLHSRKVPGGILLAILAATLIGIPMGVTIVPENFVPVSAPEAPLFFQFEFHNVLTLKFFTVFFTFFFVDIFDTVGTLLGVANQGGLLAKDGKVPRMKQALLADALGTTVGACLGTSTVTSYVESTAGVAAGGRTGLTAFTTALLFLAALFLSPIFLLIPSAATAPALVIVGFLMLAPIKNIDLGDPTEGIPAFVTIAVMPFAYSISEGIVWGILTHVILKVLTGKGKSVGIPTWILCIIFAARFVLT